MSVIKTLLVAPKNSSLSRWMCKKQIEWKKKKKSCGKNVPPSWKLGGPSEDSYMGPGVVLKYWF